MNNNTTQQEILDQHKIEVMHTIYRNLLIVMLLGTYIASFFSSWDNQKKLTFFILYTITFVILLSLIYCIRFFIQSIALKYKLYLGITLFLYALIAITLTDKFLVTLLPILPALFLIVFFSYNYKYIVYLGSLVILTIVYYFIKDATPSIELSYGYYFIFFASTIFTVTLYRRAIDMIHWYDQKLFDEIDNVFQKNHELIALNEEYYATQEELHHNYDEILKLNHSESILNHKLDALLTATEDGIVDYNISEDTYFFSKNAIQHLNITPVANFETICNKVAKEDQMALRAAWQSVVSGAKNEFTLEIHYEHQKEYSLTFIHYTSNDGVDYLLAAIKDITLVKKHERHIYSLAYTDILTGLYNRSGFIHTVDEYMNTEEFFYLAIMDIDNFKYINNIFGYDVGDIILIEIANKLDKSSFDFITRAGDDKFAFIIKDQEHLHEQMKDFMLNSELIIHDQLTLNIKYSIGISEYSGQISASELLKRAEIAMYQVKQNGKGNYSFYNAKFIKKVEERLLMGNSLEKAVANDEVFMVYQPKIDLLTEEVVSYEALVRWKSASFGFVPPDVFVDIAEQSGYIKTLSDFIINESCLFAKHLNQGKQHFLVSINISGKQLLDPLFAQSFISVLETHDVLPSCIGLEITETAVIEDLELAISELEKLKSYGLTIYLDDFGTGYSSLNYLNQLPVDILKIDKSFINHIASDTHDLQLVRSIIQLAKSLGLKTVAEGVETIEQVRLLKLYQCDIAQGYYYDKPLTTNQIESRKKSAD